MNELCMCRGSVSVKRDAIGSTEVSVKVTCDGEIIWIERGAYVAKCKEGRYR